MARVALVGAAAALLVVLSGCEKKASGQSVAVVNGEEISQSELNDELALANIPPNADKKQVLPQVLQRIVDRKLLAQQAVDQGIDRTPEYISRQRKMNEELLVGLMSQRGAQSIRIPTPDEVDAYMKSNPSMFEGREILSLNQVQFDPPADMKVLDQLKDDQNLDEVAATLDRLGIRYARTAAKLDTARVTPAVAARINGLGPGTPFVVPSRGKVVVSVITGREAAPLSQEQGRSLAAEVIRRQRVAALVDGQLKEARSKAKIEYQPGFEPKEQTAAKAK